MNEDELQTYSRLVLSIGANMQVGQDVTVNAMLEHAPLARALAEEGYAMGARYVDIWYWDPHAKRSRIRHAPEDTLGRTPPWLDVRHDYTAEHRSANIAIVGDPEPDLLAEVDPTRAAADRMPSLASRLAANMSGAVNWTIVPWPTAGWATTAFGEPDVEKTVGLSALLLTTGPTGSRRGVERARRAPHHQGFPDERASIRRAALSGARHRPDGGAHARRQVVGGGDEDGLGSDIQTQPADGGDLHSSRPQARRRGGPLDPAACHRWHGRCATWRSRSPTASSPT